MTAITAPTPPPVILLHARFPCCGRKARFIVEARAYDRRCRSCGGVWMVRRVTLPASPFALRLGVRVDSLAWERAG
jgi:hypothetical protein